MSPLEAKAYGLIDHIVGGDDAVFQVQGSTRAFPKTKEQYVNWGDEDLLDGSRGSRWGRGLVMWGGGVGWGGRGSAIERAREETGFSAGQGSASHCELLMSCRFVKPLEPHTDKVST